MAGLPTARSRFRISRRAVGKAMIAIGVMGILMGLATAVAGQTMIRQVETSVDDSLRLTTEGLSAVTDSIEVTDSMVDDVQTGMTSIRATLTTVKKSLDDTSVALTKGGAFVGGSLPTALDAVNNVLPTIQSIAKSVDDTLRLVSQVPFGPDYTPVQPFDQAIAGVTTALAPLPAELRALSSSFTALSATSSTMAKDVEKLRRDIEVLNTQLADVSPLLARYSRTAKEARTLAQSSRADLSESADLTRWLLILLGLVFALGQTVPIWLGMVLLSRTPVAGAEIVG